jgi:hypothetical protein
MRGVEDWFGTDVGDPSILEYDVKRPVACSVIHYPPESTARGSGVLSRNYDFPLDGLRALYGDDNAPQAETVAPYLIELHPANGYASLAMTAYDLFGVLDGLNEQGLCVALLGLGDVVAEAGIRLPEVAGVGLDELLLPRLLLDTCASVEEATRTIEQHVYSYRFLPCHFLIADRSGRCVVFERTLADDANVFVKGDGPMAVTNHLLHRAVPSYLTESHARCQALAAGAGSGPVDDDDIVRVNQLAFVSPAEHEYFGPAETVRSLWHAVYNTTDRTVDISFYLRDRGAGRSGTDARSPYIHRQLASRGS